MRKVLLIGRDHPLLWAMPHLLARAGFAVDAIGSSVLLKGAKFLQRYDYVPRGTSLIPLIKKRLESPYDWIIPTHDSVLSEVAKSDLSLDEKLLLLPVLTEADFVHLYSKIGLSQVFEAKGILTPPYRVAEGLVAIQMACRELGFPVLLKIDASGGGGGIVELGADGEEIPEDFLQEPILVQKKISGQEYDCSALFREGRLLHLYWARVERVCGKRFGPSNLRAYWPIRSIDQSLMEEVARAGAALGANGFINFACIETGGRRFYFEADMRPNAWVEIGRFFGDDPAEKIRAWFERRESLSFGKIEEMRAPIRVPYFLRLSLWELLSNRYRCWSYIPKEDPLLVAWLLLAEYLCLPLRQRIVQCLKRVLPRGLYQSLKEWKREMLAFCLNCNSLL